MERWLYMLLQILILLALSSCGEVPKPSRLGADATSVEVSVRGLAWYVKVVLSFAIMLGAIFLAMQMA